MDQHRIWNRKYKIEFPTFPWLHVFFTTSLLLPTPPPKKRKEKDIYAVCVFVYGNASSKQGVRISQFILSGLYSKERNQKLETYEYNPGMYIGTRWNVLCCTRSRFHSFYFYSTMTTKPELLNLKKFNVHKLYFVKQ